MNTYKDSLIMKHNLFESYQEVIKLTFPELIALTLGLYISSFLGVLLSIFVFGQLYLTSWEVLTGDPFTTRKNMYLKVGNNYLYAALLTAAVVGLCLFALVGLAVPINLIPNFLLSKIVYFGVIDIVFLAIFGILSVATSVYVAYSFMFFWIEKKDILGSIEASYRLVKGAWWRAAWYLTLSNIVPIALFIGVPALLIGVIDKNAFDSSMVKLILLTIVTLVVFPLQILSNLDYFQNLKRKQRLKG